MKKTVNNLKFDVSKLQKEVLIGLILGDAHLEKSLNGFSYRIKIEQSEKKEEYIYHLYSIFKDWTASAPKKNRNNIYFQSRYSNTLLFYGNQFYKNKKKIVPKIIYKFLTPISIAYWYMDDGSIKSKQSKGVFFNTQGFSYKETTLLSNVLKKKFKLETSLRKQKKGYQIYVSGYSYEILFNLIYPYLIESMKYKFPLPRKKKAIRFD